MAGDVEHGVSGYLAEVGDIDTMALYAIEILTDKDRAAEMGRRGRERALAKFPRDRIVGEYEELYEHVLGARPAARVRS